MKSSAISRTIVLMPVVIGVFSVVLMEPGLRAQEADAPREFDQFLEGLDSPSATSPPKRQPADGEDLGSSQPSNPLFDLAERMRSVGGRLSANDTSAATQDLQKAIAGELEELIEHLESQTAQKKAAQRSATRPSNQAGAAAESDASEEPAAAEEESQETLIESMWGKLPQRLRQQIQSPLQEEFLPSYRRVIEEYYKRIAEER